MTKHVELYDKNCEFMSRLIIIKLTKFVNFFYKKITYKIMDYSCKFMERKLAVDNNCRLFEKKIRKKYMEKLTILEH